MNHSNWLHERRHWLWILIQQNTVSCKKNYILFASRSVLSKRYTQYYSLNFIKKTGKFLFPPLLHKYPHNILNFASWPTKLKIFALQHFTENVADPRSNRCCGSGDDFENHCSTLISWLPLLSPAQLVCPVPRCPETHSSVFIVPRQAGSLQNPTQCGRCLSISLEK